MSALSVIEHQAGACAAPREVLSSRLGTEYYGLDILAVQEIRRFEPPTRIASAPGHLLGVMDLRGVIVPIVDLRQLLGLPAANSANTVTVIVTVAGRTVGLVVDAVSDVVALSDEQVKPRPPLGCHGRTDFIVGLARLDTAGGNRLLQLVDLAALLGDL